MSIFNIFNNKPIDFGPKQLEVDFHSHLIPGIDDGAKTMEESLELIQALSDLGYSRIITTPHIHKAYYPNSKEVILEGLETVRQAVKSEGIPVSIEAAAEYFMDEHFEELIEKEELLSFGDRNILVEMSFFAPSPGAEEMIFKLKTKGYRPILAHPERYAYWSGQMEKFEKVIELGAELQVNLLSLSGQYGKPVFKTAKKLIEKGMVSYLGSDLHHRGHVDRLRALFKDRKILQLINRPWKNPALHAND